MYFRFLALDSAHEVVRGTLHARDKSDAENKISNNGLTLQLLQELFDEQNIRVRSSRWENFCTIFRGRRGRLPSKSKRQFFQEMSILLRSGITVEQALQIVIDGQERTSREHDTFSRLLRDVQAGHALSDAMGMSKQNFSYSEISAVRAAEQVGRVGDVMEQLTTVSKNIESAKNKFYSAMIYPGIVLIVTIFVMMIMNMLVIPQFREIFLAQSGTDLPLLTRCVIYFCEHIGRWARWGVCGLLFLIFCQKVFYSHKGSNGSHERLLWRLPMVSGLISDYSLYLFSSILYVLLSCGLSLQQGIDSAKNVIPMNRLRKRIDDAIDDIHHGDLLSHESSGIFSRLAVGILSAGEQSGKLEDAFKEISEIYYKALLSRLAILSTIIEPVLIIFVALFVGVAVVAIFLPLMNVVHGLQI